jgi:hypothetical protein
VVTSGNGGQSIGHGGTIMRHLRRVHGAGERSTAGIALLGSKASSGVLIT